MEGKHANPFQDVRIPDNIYGILNPITNEIDASLVVWDLGYYPMSLDPAIDEIRSMNSGVFAQAFSVSRRLGRMQYNVARVKIVPHLLGVPEAAQFVAVGENRAAAFNTSLTNQNVLNPRDYPEIPAIIGRMIGGNSFILPYDASLYPKD